MQSSNARVERFIKTLDTRAMPRYQISEAARYLRTPESTLRAWFTGTTYGKRPHTRTFKPILPIGRGTDLLSFYDVASAHVLLALKTKGASTENLRCVVDSLRKEYPDALYPVLGREFFLFGRDVIIKQLGVRMNLSKNRQLGILAVMDRYLSRLELDDKNMPVRFSPIRSPHSRGKGYIVIDPELSGGRPVVRGTGVAAEVIAKRRDSGESVASLASDYRLSRRAIEEAINYFDRAEAA